MEVPPEGRQVDNFILHDMGKEDPSILRKIRRNWKNVNRLGKALLGKRNCVSKEPYGEWVKDSA